MLHWKVCQQEVIIFQHFIGYMYEQFKNDAQLRVEHEKALLPQDLILQGMWIIFTKAQMKLY